MDKATAIEKGKNIKLFISDLDGTLLSTDKDLSKNTIRAFQSLSERGIIATICTGRMITVSDFYAFELGVDVPVITANGSCIVDSKTQEVMWDAPMDKNAVTELLDYSRANNIACCVFGSSGKYASTSQDRLDECKAYDEFSIRRGGKAMPQLFIGDDYSEVLSQRIYKSYVFPDASGSFLRHA
ncbi:MAG: HAD-IIB family hydrolase [Oscillospiraceae bacterium]